MQLWNRSLTRRLLALLAPAMVVGAVLANPSSVSAQVIKPADLVGTWMRSPQVQVPAPDSVLVVETMEIYRPDSTYVFHTRWNGVLADTTNAMNRGMGGYWTLRGDTLAHFAIYKTGRQSLGDVRVARQGDRLIKLIKNVGSSCADTLRLVDETKLPPPPTLPITVDPAALAGAWARSVEHSETLVLGADKTAQVVRYFDPPRRFRTATGTWALYPGNMLGVTAPDPNPELGGKAREDLHLTSWRIVMDQGKPVKLTSSPLTCNDNPLEVWKRVGP